jgi:hypothetical protein
MGSTPGNNVSGATPGSTAGYNPAAAGTPGAYTPYDTHVYNGHPTTPGGEDGTPGYAPLPPTPLPAPELLFSPKSPLGWESREFAGLKN